MRRSRPPRWPAASAQSLASLRIVTMSDIHVFATNLLVSKRLGVPDLSGAGPQAFGRKRGDFHGRGR